MLISRQRRASTLCKLCSDRTDVRHAVGH